jgi:hypothetical protein
MDTSARSAYVSTLEPPVCERHDMITAIQDIALCEADALASVLLKRRAVRFRSSPVSFARCVGLRLRLQDARLVPIDRQITWPRIFSSMSQLMR